MRQHLQRVYQDLELELLYPTVYPALQDLPALAGETFVNGYKLLNAVPKTVELPLILVKS